MALDLFKEPIEQPLDLFGGQTRKALDLFADESREQQQVPFMARHPISYGTYGAVKETAKEIIPYMKYIDPSEREKFMELSQQKQTRELLFQNLEAVAVLGVAPIAKGAWGLFSKHLPKTAAKIGAIAKTRIAGKKPELPIKTPQINLARQQQVFRAKVPERPPVEPAPTLAVQKVVSALKEARPVRARQEALYTKARGEKLARSLEVGEKIIGEKGFYAELGALKGKMPKVQFESIRGKIGQTDIDALFNQVKSNSILSEWEKLPARKGLAKLFGEYGGAVPTEGELSLLKEVFGSDFVKAALDKRTLFQKMKGAGLELANIPRSIMASYDLSAPLRQGVFLVGRPKQWVPAFGKGFHYFVSEKAYQNLTKTLRARPTYALMKESKLALTELGTKLSAREEAFMSSWAEKIPLVGMGVRASSRAHTGFLNQLRADVFDDFIKKGVRLGIKDPKFSKDIARYINHATGRGSLGSLEKMAVPLNAFFFSPRLVTSRLNLINPAFYVKLHPAARKEALRDLFTFAGVASTTAGLMKLSGAKVGLDPRNADFMKLKFGNTRYDILGGFQQPVRLAAQLASGEIVSSTTGKTLTLGEGYKPITRLGIVERFFEYKESPIASFVTSLLRGQTSLGEKTDVPTEVANRFVPMVIQDMVDLYNERGLEGMLLASPAIFGVGVQTYGGVQSYGLEGRKYPELNAELQRLKTSMGFPSTSAYGQELTNKEYKNLKRQSGLEIAKELTSLISRPNYSRWSDTQKIQFIERKIDQTKEKVKRKMFPQKRRLSEIARRIKEITPLRDEEARALAEEKLKRVYRR